MTPENRRNLKWRGDLWRVPIKRTGKMRPDRRYLFAKGNQKIGQTGNS
jgi:hypothetical protein